MFENREGGAKAQVYTRGFPVITKPPKNVVNVLNLKFFGGKEPGVRWPTLV